MVSFKLYDFSEQNKALKDKITLEESIHQNQISEILKRYDSLNKHHVVTKHHEKSVNKENVNATISEIPVTKNVNKSTSEKKLKAININARGVQLISNDVVETNISSKIDQVRIRFTLEKNSELEAGNKHIAIQVVNPENHTLALKGSMETKLVKKIYYNGLNTDACLFVDFFQHHLTMGEYKINLIYKGDIIGSTNFRVN
jgi:hypothetical protein